MKTSICLVLILLSLAPHTSAQDISLGPNPFSPNPFGIPQQETKGFAFTVAQMMASSGLAVIDPWAILRAVFYEIILYWLTLYNQIIGTAQGYWTKIKGFANLITKPIQFIKTIANDWLENCTPEVPLPNFMDQFMDFVSGKAPFACCDEGILDYLLKDMGGGPIHWMDETGTPFVAPTNTQYALKRYELAKFLTTLGPDRKELEKAAVKGSEIHDRVLSGNYNAAAAQLDAWTGLMKVEAARMDIKSSDVMFAAQKKMQKLRGAAFLQTANSAAIVGVFGVDSSSQPSSGTTSSGFQNLFETEAQQ
jgi:hypothetical protein